MDNKEIQKQIAIIEDGLDGIWVLEALLPQCVSFTKPSFVGGWGKLMIGNTPDLISHQLLEYQLVWVEAEICFINIMVKTSDSTIAYKIDGMNSYIGYLYLIPPLEKPIYYKRLNPRIQEK